MGKFTKHWLDTKIKKENSSFLRFVALKGFLTSTLVFTLFSVFATNYYVSTAGNDANSGTSESSAWKSLAKVSGQYFQPGDEILFRKGDLFKGELRINSSGTAGSPILFGAYGTGEKPVITGLETVTNWVEHSTGIYKASVNFSGDLNLVVLNDKPVALGRYPNEGYLHFESHSGTGSIVDYQLGSYPNWTGAEVVVRTNHWVIDRNPITSHSGNTINFDASSGYAPRDGFGYFIQSDIRTLDQFGEWYFDNGTLYMYFGGSNPYANTVQVSNTDILVTMQGKHYVQFNDLDFTGANDMGLYVDYSSNIKIENCSIRNMGDYGVQARGAEYFHAENNDIDHCLSVGIRTKWGSDNAKFIGNNFTDIGMMAGMGGSADGTYIGLCTSSENAIIRYNHVERVGYAGIDFDGNNSLVENNFINYFCQYKDDGGGIYSFFSGDTGFRYSGVKVRNNIILNGGGYMEGAGVDAETPNQVEGIYTDGLTNSFEIYNNTIVNTASTGIFLNTPRWHNVHDNLLVNNHFSAVHFNNLYMEGQYPQGNTVNNNVIVTKSGSQHIFHLTDGRSDAVFNYGSSDGNKVVNVGSEESKVYAVYYNGGWRNDYYKLSEWKSAVNQDANSSHTTTSENGYIFEYNASKTTKIVALNQSMVDMQGNSYSGSVSIEPYSSVFLIPDENGGGSSSIYVEEDYSMCEGESYNGWTESGVYQRVLQSVSGEDSIVTTNLTVNPVYDLTEYVTISEGESYNGHTVTGEYTDNYTSISGCDSTVTTFLTIAERLETEEYITICEGNSYEGWTTSGVYQRTEMVPVDGAVGEATNLFDTDNFTNSTEGWYLFEASGYDAEVVMDVDEYASGPAGMRIDCNSRGDISYYLQLIADDIFSVEEGKQYVLSFKAKASNPFNIGSLVMMKGTSPWTEYGNFSNASPYISGEWSEVKLTFTATHTASDASFRIYLGNSLPVGGSLYLDDFFFAENAGNGEMQEQVITTYLTVNQVDEVYEDVVVAEGEDYYGWTTPGQYERTLSNVFGCDSIVITNLSVQNTIHFEEDIAICEGEEYEGWTTSGTYQRTLPTSSGQDSVVTTYLVVNPVYTTIEEVTISEGEEYLGHTESGEYARNLTSSTGCDSIVTTILTVNTTMKSVEYVAICEGTSYNGWTESGEYERTVIVSGDSTMEKSAAIVNEEDFSAGTGGWSKWGATGYEATINHDNTEFASAPAGMRIDCESNGSVVYYLQIIAGEELTIEDGKKYELSFKAKATSEFTIGSLVMQKPTSPWNEYGTFTESRPVISTEWTEVNVLFNSTSSASDASFRIYLGNSMPAGESLYIDDFSFAEYVDIVNPQEEIITTYLTVNSIDTVFENIVIKEGEDYVGWNEAGVYYRNLSAVAGCDSVVVTDLSVLSKIYNEEDISICEGESYLGYTTSGQFIQELEAVSGADSIVTTNLFVNPVYDITEEVAISEGESYNGWTESGIYIDTLSTLTGCDSIVTTILTVDSSIYYEEDVFICEGESYLGWSMPGPYERILTSAEGADSIVITNLIVNQVYYIIEDIFIAEGESYMGWTEPGEYDRTLTSEAGCDSIVVTNLAYTNFNHFETVWEGSNGVNHMNIYVADAYVDGDQLLEGDEIAVFDGDLCVGAAKLVAPISPNSVSSYLHIIVSLNDGSGNGYTEGNNISFKTWDASKQQEADVSLLSYKNSREQWSTSGTFIPGATSVVELGVEPVEQVTQVINLKKGWNIFSSFVTPDFMSMDSIQKELLSSGDLIKVQDEQGNTFENWSSLNQWINYIGDISNTEGYKIKVASSCALNITGQVVELPIEISLKTGWNLISFPVNTSVDAMDVIQPLIDAGALEKVQDEQGNSIENWGNLGWINNITNFNAGEGYKVKVNVNYTLTINELFNKSGFTLPEVSEPTYFKVDYEGNGSDHMNINIIGLSTTGLKVGDEIAAFDNNICVGALKLNETHFTNDLVSVKASVSDNGAMNGFVEGHSIELKSWSPETNYETIREPEIVEGELLFHRHSSVFVKLDYQVATGIEDISLLEIKMYPNPATDMVTVKFSDSPSIGSKILISDLSGKTVIKRDVQDISEVIQVSSLISGTYFVRVITDNEYRVQKLIVR